MKVLYIGHFTNGTSGWRQAALDYLLAMDSVGIDVVPRSVRLNDSKPEMPERYKELESKSIKGCDVVIQHVLPHHLKYDGRFNKNIALCVYESAGQFLSNWDSKINMMDELWVPSEFTRNVFDSSGITRPIKIVPHTFNLNKYKQKYDKIDNSDISGNYIFYTIADLNIRKNLRAIVEAFHLEFTPNEPVKLIIKSQKFGKSAQETFELIKSECDKIKDGMKLYRNRDVYHRELIITTQLSELELMQLHATGNCYVNSSHGEAWCIPLFEAMAMGKQLIFPEHMYDYLDDYYPSQGMYPITSSENICFGCTDTFWEIGSSRESWNEYSINNIAEQMRRAYNERNLQNDNSYIAENYNYETVGNHIRSMLW